MSAIRTHWLNEPFELSHDALAQFRQNGFVRLSEVFPPEHLNDIGQEITRLTLALNRELRPLNQRDTYAPCRSAGVDRRPKAQGPRRLRTASGLSDEVGQRHAGRPENVQPGMKLQPASAGGPTIARTCFMVMNMRAGVLANG